MKSGGKNHQSDSLDVRKRVAVRQRACTGSITKLCNGGFLQAKLSAALHKTTSPLKYSSAPHSPPLPLFPPPVDETKEGTGVARHRYTNDVLGAGANAETAKWSRIQERGWEVAVAPAHAVRLL